MRFGRDRIGRMQARTPALRIKKLVCFIVCALLLFGSNADAKQRSDREVFQELYSLWTAAFNKRDLPACCALFAKDVSADYKGAKHKTYDRLCKDFRRVFADKDRQYKYSFELHDIHREGNLATVRITWHFTVSEPKKPPVTTTDQGLDVLRKQPDGRWQIVNYLGYQD